MSKTVTSGKRYLKNDLWHDDNGLIPATPDGWEPPMTFDEIEEAARSDPDAQPLTDEQLGRMRRIAFAKHLRIKLRLGRDEFARRYGIPLETLVAWERHEAEPDAVAANYLRVIAADPDGVARLLMVATAAAAE